MKELFIQPKASIKDALKQLSKSGKSCLIVVNKTNKLLGTLTDGDVRRVILKGKFLKDQINGIYEKNPILLKKGNYLPNQIKDLFLKKKVDVIPIVDSSKKVVDLIFFTDLFKKNKSNNNSKTFSKTVIIMAGG